MQCPSCSTEIGTNTSFCPQCGANLAASTPPANPQWSTPTPPHDQPPAQWSAPPPQYAAASAAQPVAQSGLSDNMAGALAYVTIIPAILFLIIDPYKQSSFVRFHSFQSIFLGVGALVLHFVLAFIPIVGWIIGLLVSLGLFVLWIILLLKASRGERFKVPIIGDLAEQQAKNF